MAVAETITGREFEIITDALKDAYNKLNGDYSAISKRTLREVNTLRDKLAFKAPLKDGSTYGWCEDLAIDFCELIVHPISQPITEFFEDE